MAWFWYFLLYSFLGYLLEKLLDGDHATGSIFGILDRYHRRAAPEETAEPDITALLHRLAQSIPLAEKLQLTAAEPGEAHD